MEKIQNKNEKDNNASKYSSIVNNYETTSKTLINESGYNISKNDQKNVFKQNNDFNKIFESQEKSKDLNIKYENKRHKAAESIFNKDNEEDNSKLGIFNISEINLVNLKNSDSYISCHAKPNLLEILKLKKLGVNFILSIISDKDNPEEIKKICEVNEIYWKRLDLYGANMKYFHTPNVKIKLISTLVEVYNFIKEKRNINLFVHCSYGLHRTGTFVYSLLRIFGDNEKEAFAALNKIRVATAENVHEKRLIYAEKEIIPYCNDIISKVQIDPNVVDINKIDYDEDSNFTDLTSELSKKFEKDNLSKKEVEQKYKKENVKINDFERENKLKIKKEKFVYTNSDTVNKRENIYLANYI